MLNERGITMKICPLYRCTCGKIKEGGEWVFRPLVIAEQKLFLEKNCTVITIQEELCPDCRKK